MGSATLDLEQRKLICCPECHSSDIRKDGHPHNVQRYECPDCGRKFNENTAHYLPDGVEPATYKHEVKSIRRKARKNFLHEVRRVTPLEEAKPTEVKQPVLEGLDSSFGIPHIGCPHCLDISNNQKGFTPEGEPKYQCKGCASDFTDTQGIALVRCPQCESLDWEAAPIMPGDEKAPLQCNSCKHEWEHPTEVVGRFLRAYKLQRADLIARDEALSLGENAFALDLSYLLTTPNQETENRWESDVLIGGKRVRHLFQLKDNGCLIVTPV